MINMIKITFQFCLAVLPLFTNTDHGSCIQKYVMLYALFPLLTSTDHEICVQKYVMSYGV